MNQFPKSDRVDVMLLLEGTFPFVSGGVSNWVHQMIKGFPEYSFGAVFIGSRREEYGAIKYELPPNLIHVEAIFLHELNTQPEIRPIPGNMAAIETVRQLHAWFMNPDPETLDSALKDVNFYLDPKTGVDFSQFLYAKGSWDLIAELFQQRCCDPSFLDYFWTVRCMHTPIWLLAKTAQGLIPARIYHSVSTGYAGFLGALLHHNSDRPMVLSEHGIYTKERRIDILQSDWIQDNRNTLQKNPTEISYHRDLWIRFFETVGRFCYGAAHTIVALFEGAREREISDGAPEERTTVIPNGIDISRFAAIRVSRLDSPPQVLTLLGRIVPIKDIKTFIRALRLIANSMPSVQGWITGPEDESPEYAAECRTLVESLDITANVTFLGFRDPLEIFPGTGVLVLSSISEGLPLVILEAFAAGIPVVATDVGACRQLITGFGPEDEAIGTAGAIVGINNPHNLATEALRLLSDSSHWQRSREAAITRVERYYTQKNMFDRYRDIYRRGMD